MCARVCGVRVCVVCVCVWCGVCVLRVLCILCALICLLCVSISRPRFVDDEAAGSESDSDVSVQEESENADDAPAASQQSLGSLADFIAEPSSQEMEHAGLAFHSDDENPLAVLRDRRPFRSFRRMEEGGGAAAASAAAASSLPRRRVPKPATAQLGAATAADGDVEGMALLQSTYGGAVDSSFVSSVAGCSSWLTDVSLLHDESMLEQLHGKLLQGYTYDRVVKRQGKVDQLNKTEAGLMELTACVDYCTHILSEKLCLLWSGGACTPGVQTAGSLMLPDPAAHGMVCVEATMHGKPLDLSAALLQLVLGHPGNIRWRDMVVGRKLYVNSQLIFLVQNKVSSM